MKLNGGKFLNEIRNIKNGKFLEVILLEPSKDCVIIKKEQFYESLANIACRCIT